MKLFSNKKLLFTFLVVMTLVVTMSLVVFADGGEAEEFQSMYYASFWALVPPVVAIGLALITKEVYSSLFLGILAGGLIYLLTMTK